MFTFGFYYRIYDSTNFSCLPSYSYTSLHGLSKACRTEAELTFSEPMTFFMGRVYNVFVLSPLYDVYAIYVVFKV